MIIPPPVAAFAALWDPQGFQRVEEAYKTVGQHFWSPKAYAFGTSVKRVRVPILATLFVSLLSVAMAIAFKLNGVEM